MKQKTLAALDVGTKFLKMAVAKTREEPGELEVLGVAEEPSVGVRKGVVSRPEETAKHIAALARKAEQMTGQRIEEVYVTLGGSRLFATPSHGLVAVSRADGHISQEDIDRVMLAAQTFSLSHNQEILEAYPLRFTVDGEEGVKEPIGMRAVRLEADVLAVCMFSPDVKNLTNAVLDAGLEIADIVPIPFAASEAVLSPQDKELGVAVVDLGAATTSLAVFEEGELLHLSVLPVGSENITNDLAIGLRTEHETAERVKIEYGSCAAPKGRKQEKIELPSGEVLSFRQREVFNIIEPRVKEILQLVQKELKKIERQGKLPGGVVLCGGGAKLPKLVEYAKKELKLPVRIGAAQGIVVQEANPAHLAALGLLIGAQEGEGKEVRPQSAGRFLNFLKRMFKSFIP